MMSRIALRALTGAALAMAALHLPAAHAEPRAWDQAAATAVASKLADKAEAFHEAIRKQGPDGSLGPLTKDEWDLVELHARHLDERTRALASSLAEGQDRAETQGGYENIETTLRNLAEHARSEWVPQRIYNSWADLRSTHLALANYYGDHDVDPRLEDIRVEPQR
jgi:hypothetical protein